MLKNNQHLMLNKTEQARILSLLQQLGCNKHEAQLYLHCLGLGPASVQQIARVAKRKRLTVHSAIEQLIEMGFLYEGRKGKRRLIVAKSPDRLLDLIQRKQNELELMKSNAEHLIPLLHMIHPKGGSIPSVKFYEDVDGLKAMLEETLSAKGEVLVFSYVELLAKLLEPDYLENYFKRRAKKGIHTRLIFPPCAFAERVNKKKEKYNIQIRLLPKHYHWQSGIFFWNDSMALLSYTKEKVTCTIIENADIAHFYRTVIFELCWRQAEAI